MSLTDIQDIWDKLANQTAGRQEHIMALDTSLTDIEWKRSERVAVILRDTAMHLQTIAYLQPMDVQRLVEEEAQVVNMAILANRRTYCQLCMHLSTGKYQWLTD